LSVFLLSFLEFSLLFPFSTIAGISRNWTS
jgi:hypothetical protein